MKVTAKAPINIALIKYWGKQPSADIKPYNDSISLTLDALYTITTVETHPEGLFSYRLNDRLILGNDLTRIWYFLQTYFPKFKANPSLKITAKNHVPTAAGLASSASGFAALTLALARYYKMSETPEDLAKIAKQGSGSSARSFYGGYVSWKTDGTIAKIPGDTDTLCFVIVLVDANEKYLSSREAMKRTVATAHSYHTYVKESQKKALNMEKAIADNDFSTIGRLTETHARHMHETMSSAMPPIQYLTNESRKVLDVVAKMQDQGIKAYATMDAGSNVKILTKTNHLDDIQTFLHNHGYRDLILSKISNKGAEILE